MASAPLKVVVNTSGNNITVKWETGNGGDNMVIGYRVIYHDSDSNDIIFNTSSTEKSHIFTEYHRVYTVSVQALSKHIPSAIIGPFTVRGMCGYIIVYC